MGKDSVDAKVTKYIKKYKKRMKRILACGIIWWLIGIACLAIGIAFLVNFHEYWGDETSNKRHLAYAGVGLILVCILFIGVGIALCVTLYILYQRLSANKNPVPFVHRKFAYGEAPYPQQPPMNQPQQPAGQPNAPPPGSIAPSPGSMVPPTDPNAPPPPGFIQQGAYPTDQAGINIEISEHNKF